MENTSNLSSIGPEDEGENDESGRVEEVALTLKYLKVENYWYLVKVTTISREILTSPLRAPSPVEPEVLETLVPIRERRKMFEAGGPVDVSRLTPRRYGGGAAGTSSSSGGPTNTCFYLHFLNTTPHYDVVFR